MLWYEISHHNQAPGSTLPDVDCHTNCAQLKQDTELLGHDQERSFPLERKCQGLHVRFQISDDVVLGYDRTWFPRMPDSRDTNSLHNKRGSHRTEVPSRIVQSEIKIEWNKLRTLIRNVQRRLNEALIDNSVCDTNGRVSSILCAMVSAHSSTRMPLPQVADHGSSFHYCFLALCKLFYSHDTDKT